MTTSLYDLTPGTRVTIQHNFGPTGPYHGVIVEMPKDILLNRRDYAVMLDGTRAAGVRDRDCVATFWAHELAAEK